VADATTKKSRVQPIADSLAVFAPDIEEGSLLRFDVNLDQDNPSAHDYTYAALWIARKWWVTGRNTIFTNSGMDHGAFMAALAKFGAHNIVLATKFEKVK
jgi:hypothetical protein